MNSIGLPTPSVSTSAFIANPAAQQPVGQEDIDTKKDIFKAVEETSETSASKTSPDSKTQVKSDNPQSEQEQQELAVIRELASRDREVRAHEQAHASVGGQYAGAASFTYQRGPNGVSYAVGGEVPISAPTGGDPQAALQAAEQIQRAALAPANPSSQDRQVAAQAAQTATQARAEIAVQKSEERTATGSDGGSTPETEDTAKTQEKNEADTAEGDNNSTTQAFENVTNASDVGSILNQLA